jgi:hypothetical protein
MIRMAANSGRNAAEDPLLPWLESLTEDELADEILELADGDRAIRTRLELRAAAQTADAELLTRVLGDLLATDGHLSSARAREYADGVYQAAEAIDGFIEAEEIKAGGEYDAGADPATAAVELARQSFGLVLRARADADDSPGAIGEAAREILSVHLRACEAAQPPPDPVGLGTYLADLLLNDRFGLTPSLTDYADLLGRDGALAIRERIAAVHAADPSNENARHLTESLSRPRDEAPRNRRRTP